MTDVSSDVIGDRCLCDRCLWFGYDADRDDRPSKLQVPVERFLGQKIRDISTANRSSVVCWVVKAAILARENE
jgi:hypothetical protein